MKVFALRKPKIQKCESRADRHNPAGMGETRALVKVIADGR